MWNNNGSAVKSADENKLCLTCGRSVEDCRCDEDLEEPDEDDEIREMEDIL